MKTYTIEINEEQAAIIANLLRYAVGMEGDPRSDEQEAAQEEAILIADMMDGLAENDEPGMVHGLCY